MTTRPNNPTSASRWRKKRMRAYDHWLRTLRSRPAACVSSTAPTTTEFGAMFSPSSPWALGKRESSVGARGPWGGLLASVIADARVEEAVRDVCDQVEDDNCDRRDQQVGHHRVEIEGVEALDEEEADAVEREDGLRDDRAAKQRAEVEGGDSRDRNQRVAEDVAHDHPPLRHALRTSGTHVVAVDHVEHRGAHVAAVEREADDAEGCDRQREMLHPVPRPRRPAGKTVQARGVEDPNVVVQEDVRERDLQQQREPERRHGEAQEADRREHVVEDRVLANRGVDADRDPEDDREDL